MSTGLELRGILNDIKRRPEDAAKDLNIPLELLESILSGKSALPPELIAKASQVWPVNIRDFYPIEDDCPTGIKLMTADQSLASARVMDRGGNPYYEYRDTVMTKVVSFRPEWIKELCIVQDSNPKNETVHWNKGHFMHQFTYFIGPVNFYFLDELGQKCVAEMNTGDSMYISPYVPHTFATRKNPEGTEGLILALTFGDKVAGDSLHQLQALGADLGEKFFLNFSSRENSFSALLGFHLDALSLSPEQLSRESGIPLIRLHTLLKSGIPERQEIECLASCLSVNVRDLLPHDATPQRVTILPRSKNRTWSYPSKDPSYSIRELATSAALPSTKALLLNVEVAESHDFDLCFGLHQYVYNSGETPVSVAWEHKGSTLTKEIKAGDSAYIKPFVPHAFYGIGQLLTLRIGGHLAGDPLLELSSIGREYAHKIICDSEQWFNPGKPSHAQ